jgi:parallel beta-helix repeat protein
MSISSVPSKHQSYGNLIIVDDEGDGDFLSIKEALFNADLGDTIEVYSGDYFENGIEISIEHVVLKGISYELGNGNDTGRPFLNGEGKNCVIFCNANDIVIDNFHIENSGEGQYDIINISLNANGCTVSNNFLANTSIRHIYAKSSNNKIINNTISHSFIDSGICVRKPSGNNLLEGNVISDCDTGVCIWSSNANTIKENIITGCRGFGIHAVGSANKIFGNHLEDNVMGIEVWIFFNRIEQNNFINNSLNARFVYSMPLLPRFFNRWFNNYWDKPRELPYLIPGKIGFSSALLLPWFPQFDRHPAQEPHDILIRV